MANQDIRLRLAIRRHGVPEVKLVWPCSRLQDMTIAKLLTLVNEVVPLESSQWGLEDYAVELTDKEGGSFECLHFQLVSQTLKDEDQVIIRSLLSDDIKRRLLSGRHQISTDGKHLVDGVAFGRPWLRLPRDRPALELPPRKRPRITEQEMSEPPQLLLMDAPRSSEHDDPSSVRVDSMFYDADADFDDDSEDDDDDFEPEQVENEDEEEDDLLQLDGSVASSGQEDEDEIDDDGDELVDERDDIVEELRQLIDEDGTVPAAADSESDEESNLGLAGLDICSVEDIAALRAAYPLLSINSIEKALLRNGKVLRKAYDALKSKNDPLLTFDDMMDRMVSGLLSQEQASAAPEGPLSIVGQENPRPRPNKPLIQVVESSGESSLEETETSASSSSDEDSSDESSTSEEDSDEESSDSSTGGNGAIVENSSSEDDSDDDSDSNSSSSNEASESAGHDVTTNAQVLLEQPPHQGLTRTQKRNARRKRAKALLSQNQSHEPSNAGSNIDDTEFLARKQALLGALLQEVPTEHLREEVTNSPPVNGQAEKAAKSPAVNGNGSVEATSRPRAKVDMGAGRRMLFGALGLKAPKNKADEEKLKQGLMKDIKPLRNARIVEVVEDNAPTSVDEEDDTDAWKEKITYRAVECCHEGMVLSEPPFPFVQRWDPQQQYKSMRKRKRQSDAYYDDSYVEEDSTWYPDTTTNGDENQSASKKVKGGEGMPDTNGGMETDVAQVTATNGVDVEEEELPELPKQLDSLPVLAKGAAKEGMVITWKQWTLSKTTSWQPVIASVTGRVLSGSDENSLSVKLAIRDREYEEKVYDDKGKRIYEKFEVPGLDEDESEEDDGYRTLAWTDMMEPRIVQSA